MAVWRWPRSVSVTEVLDFTESLDREEIFCNKQWFIIIILVVGLARHARKHETFNHCILNVGSTVCDAGPTLSIQCGCCDRCDIWWENHRCPCTVISVIKCHQQSLIITRRLTDSGNVFTQAKPALTAPTLSWLVLRYANETRVKTWSTNPAAQHNRDHISNQMEWSLICFISVAAEGLLVNSLGNHGNGDPHTHAVWEQNQHRTQNS